MAAQMAVKKLHFSHIKPQKICIYLSGDYVCPQIRVCGTGERAQESADLPNPCKKPGIVACTCHLYTGQAGTGEFLSLTEHPANLLGKLHVQ